MGIKPVNQSSGNLAERQILLMLEICIEAENRAEKRMVYARNTGDLRTVAYELQLLERYANLKRRLLDESKRLGVATEQAQA